MPKKCKCLEIVRKKLSEHHKSPIDFELKQTINTETLELGSDLPPLYYTYTVAGKRKRSYVTFNFCPFCGLKNS
jgi:hypothetical protein